MEEKLRQITKHSRSSFQQSKNVYLFPPVPASFVVNRLTVKWHNKLHLPTGKSDGSIKNCHKWEPFFTGKGADVRGGEIL